MNENRGSRQAGRPDMPQGYGLAPVNSENELIPWESAEEKLREARNYWICSTRPDGRPHAMPVWGLWVEGAFYFSTDPQSRKGRNLAGNPEVVLHLESGDDAVILEGRSGLVSDAALVRTLDELYFRKYQFHLAGDEAAPGVVYVVRPRQVMAWLESSFPTSATRWKFKSA